MPFRLRASLLHSCLIASVLFGSAAASAQSADVSFKAAPPKFTDPQRRQKLATAFPEIDRIMRDFVTKNQFPAEPGASSLTVNSPIPAAPVSASFRRRRPSMPTPCFASPP